MQQTDPSVSPSGSSAGLQREGERSLGRESTSREASQCGCQAGAGCLPQAWELVNSRRRCLKLRAKDVLHNNNPPAPTHTLRLLSCLLSGTGTTLPSLCLSKAGVA